MAEELSETDIPSSSEDEDGKVTEISSGNAETEDSSLSERSAGKKDVIPQASQERKSESIPADKESTSGSTADPQQSVAKSTVTASTSPKKSKSILENFKELKDKLIKKRQGTVSSEELCSTDEVSTNDGPAASSVSSVSGQDVSRTSISAGSSSNSKKGVGSLPGRALSAIQNCGTQLKSFVNMFHPKDREKISIVVTDEDRMDTEPAYQPSFEAPTPPAHRPDLETLDVVPKIYEESPDITETTTVSDSENKKDSSDAEARRAGMSSQEVSSVEKDSEESSRRESSDVLADVSSEEKDETHLKVVKRTPLKRQRKMEEDSSDSDTGTAAPKSGQKRSPQTKRTTRF